MGPEPQLAPLRYVAIWLPCGVQNFSRTRTHFDPLRFASERPLLERFESRYGTAQLRSDVTRNLRFAWWPVGDGSGTSSYYLDSDGFIVAVGTDPHLPFLADPSFSVARTGDQPEPWLAEWPLTSFQANLLFEGVWNSSFDPAVFLLTDRLRAGKIESSFTFGKLLASIEADGVYADPITPEKPHRAAILGEVLERTVRSLRNDHLLPLKWNVEAARRRLFSETMTLLHRQENLHQFTVGRSDLPNATESDQSRDQLFVNTSDLQLRGYVSLVSAKLPLIDNMRYLMEDALQSLGRDPDLEHAPDQKARLEITREIVDSWVKLAVALSDNVAALEKSFETVWQASMFHEIEQVRVEEESLSELQREASQEREGKWFDTFLLAVTLGATVAVLVDAVNKGGEGASPPVEVTTPVGSPGPDIITSAGGSPTHGLTHFGDYVGLLGVVIGVCALLYVVSLVVRRRVHGFIPRYEQVTRLDERFKDNKVPLSVPLDGERDAAELEYPKLVTTWNTAAIELPGCHVKPVSRRWARIRMYREAFAAVGIDVADDIAFGALHRCEVQRARVDTPSDADTFLRLHLKFTFLLSSVRTGFWRFLPGNRIEPPIAGLHGLVNRALARLTNTLPLRRAELQLAIEFHKHWPDATAPALLVLRETRAVAVSRKALSLTESVALLHFVDILLMSQILPDYPPQPGRTNQEVRRDRPVQLSLLADRAMAYDKPDGIRFLGQPHREHSMNARNGDSTEQHHGTGAVPRQQPVADVGTVGAHPNETDGIASTRATPLNEPQ